MGGCRCTYRNCSVRSDKHKADTKIHFFHYPAYEKLRCRQWIINAQRYEFLDLKVSQLRNRVICQYHFRDECFMNYKKEKLKFKAVPTEDGPYCDSTKEEIVNEEVLEKANLVLNDIEQDITYIDKKANSSLKYIDFLANIDPPMVSEGLNSLSIEDDTGRPLKNEKEDRLIVTYEHPKAEENIKFKKKYTIVKNPFSPIKYDVNHIKPNYQIRKDNEDIVENVSPNQRPNITFHNNINHNITNISFLPMGVAIPITYESIEQLNQQSPQIVDNLNHGQISNSNTASQFLFSNNLQMQSAVHQSLFNETQNSLQSHNEVNEAQKDMKVKILSEKTILEPLPFVGKLEPVLPSLILPVPNRLKDQSFGEHQISQSVSETNNIPIFSQVSQSMTTEHGLNNGVIEVGTFEASDKNDIVNKDLPKIEILDTEAEKSTKSKLSNISSEQKSNTREKASDSISKLSILKNKVSPERLAAIEQKRLFNKKLRDMVETCLEKPNDQDKLQTTKSKGNILKRKDSENVDTSIAKGSQDYTISYLESRMIKMQNILLKKIEQNSSRIMELKSCVVPQKSKSMSTQTPASEESYKVYLYDEISKFLSPKAKNYVYEDLFIYKYSQSKTDCETTAKRKRYR